MKSCGALGYSAKPLHKVLLGASLEQNGTRDGVHLYINGTYNTNTEEGGKDNGKCNVHTSHYVLQKLGRGGI